MMHRPLLLVPGLVLLVSTTVMAADPLVPGSGLDSSGTLRQFEPGKIQSTSRSVFLQGLIDLDAIQQGNYTDGNGDLSDHRSQGWYRAELGARISVDERIEVQVSLAGQGIMGGNLPTDNGAIYGVTGTNGPDNGQTGNAVIDDAFVKLKDFLNYRELALDAGRMPVSYNLRRDHAAFLYDSRADYRTITSWDGLRAAYNLDSVNILPYVYRLPDNSQLYGLSLEWEPPKSGNDRLFFQGSANLERNVLLHDGTTGDSLQTYYVGGDADLGDFELFGEFAMQSGKQTDSVKFKGFAFSGGIDWHIDNTVVGFQGDYFTGDDNPTDGENKAFINNWEGMSDTDIVENEKYGEMSRLLTGNLHAYKGKIEIALDDKKRVRVKSIYAMYKTDVSLAGSGSKNFGQEVDIHLAWDYTRNATITLLGGVFKPDDAYKAARTAAPVSVVAGTDLIYLLGANLLVKF